MKKFCFLFLILIALITLSACNNQEKYEFDEIDIIVETDGYSLSGKLTLPQSSDKVPGVIFVHGSGASDMNESVGALKLFEDLAIGLAEKGIASIRYDKRTYAYAQQLVTKKDFTIYEEVIDDALSAIEQLKSNDKISDIYIIGHSFGGQLAPVIANMAEVKGVIILAGTTEHIIDIAMSQLKEQNSPYYEIYDQYDEYFRNIKEVVPNEEGYYFLGAYEEYWVSYNNIDIHNEILKCGENKKMLVLQGELDLQVKASELESYKNILLNTNAQYKLYESLNHMFVDGEGETLINAYLEKKNVPNIVIEDIVDFIKSNKFK